MSANKLLTLNSLVISYDDFQKVCIESFNKVFDEYLSGSNTDLVPTFTIGVPFKKGIYIKKNYLDRLKM